MLATGVLINNSNDGKVYVYVRLVEFRDAFNKAYVVLGDELEMQDPRNELIMKFAHRIPNNSSRVKGWLFAFMEKGVKNG